MIAAANSRFTSLETAKVLLQSGADVNARDDNNVTALHLAMGVEPTPSLALVSLLLASGAHVNAGCKGMYSAGGVTPLMKVFESTFSPKALAVVKLLLRSGAKLEALDQGGHTAYDYAKQLVPDEIYSEASNWLRDVLGDALDFFEERRRVLEGRVQLLVLRKLVEKGRAAPVPGGSAGELKITCIFGTRSMPDDIFSKVLAFWHPPGSPRPRRYRSWSQYLPLTP